MLKLSMLFRCQSPIWISPSLAPNSLTFFSRVFPCWGQRSSRWAEVESPCELPLLWWWRNLPSWRGTGYLISSSLRGGHYNAFAGVEGQSIDCWRLWIAFASNWTCSIKASNHRSATRTSGGSLTSASAELWAFHVDRGRMTRLIGGLPLTIFLNIWIQGPSSSTNLSPRLSKLIEPDVLEQIWAQKSLQVVNQPLVDDLKRPSNLFFNLPKRSAALEKLGGISNGGTLRSWVSLKSKNSKKKMKREWVFRF